VTPGRVVAGIDVGNSTTEVLLADVSCSPPAPLAWDRMPTRGRKGSAEAAVAAAALTRRLARRHGLALAAAACAPQQPVETRTVTEDAPPPDTGRLRVLARASGTPGRPGWGAGRPVPADAEPVTGDDVVLVVPPGFGYRRAANAVRGWLAAGAAVAAVLVADDEGVLVANRVPAGFPVLDGADAAAVLAAARVAVEVGGPDTALAGLTDPLRLTAVLGLADGDRPHARGVAAALGDATSAAVGVVPGAPAAAAAPADAGPRPDTDVADGTWEIRLAEVVRGVEARPGVTHGRGTVRSSLVAAEAVTTADALGAELGVPVTVVGSEAEAARAGALTTPGASPAAWVLDLGAGTIDVVRPGGRRVLAGAGELVTAATALLLGIPRSTADWAKRGPCARVEGPHVLAGEDGGRTFLDRPAAAGVVGALTVPGPAGPLAFSRDLSPAEWRVLRRRLKRAAIADNLARALAGAEPPGDVVLVGGVAGDPELPAVLDEALPGAAVGRGDVASGAGPGHRWAVAYGLSLLSSTE
jgi:hypothetical protein